MKRALVLDGRTLSSLAVARSLGNAGYTVDCGETFTPNITQFSKYVDETVSYPPADKSHDAFYHAIMSTLTKSDYDVLIPTRDATTRAVSARKEEIEQQTNVFVAPPRILDQFVDKGKTIKLAQEAQIPTPTTYFPDETSLEEIAKQLEYPALIRPKRGSGSRGITMVEDRDDLESSYKKIQKKFGDSMIQEYVKKSGYTTAAILFDEEQNEVASFTYERQKEYPLDGGPTVVGESTDDDDAKHYAKKLLTEGSWYGPAEVEFILDEDGTPRLLEVNPRFWMPVHLAVVAGVDFPSNVAHLAEGIHVKPTTQYRTGVTYRWILPNEILHTVASRELLNGVLDMAKSPFSDTCYGILSTEDPLPTLGAVGQSLSFLMDEEKRKSVLDRGA
ncbi:hypothetical protein DJ84_23580 [Halorubrum ezzemoulense]|nr:hypothetical protein DJ84_23580 [Halorubrum ezzemoulense]